MTRFEGNYFLLFMRFASERGFSLLVVLPKAISLELVLLVRFSTEAKFCEERADAEDWPVILWSIFTGRKFVFTFFKPVVTLGTSLENCCGGATRVAAFCFR